MGVFLLSGSIPTATINKFDIKWPILSTVESRSNGPASNGNPPIREAILQYLEKFFSRVLWGNLDLG